MAEIEIRAFDRIAVVQLTGLLVVGIHRTGKAGSDVFERDTAFRTLRTGHRGYNVAEVEFQRVGEDKVGTIAVAPHALGLRIGFDERDPVMRAAGHREVVDGFAIDREEAAGRAIFRTHVADRRAIGERHVVHARAEEFDELGNDALLAQHLHDGQNEVGRGYAFLQLAGQLEADNFGQKHRDRLAEHGGFSFDTTDTPAENAEAVDHRRMRDRCRRRCPDRRSFRRPLPSSRRSGRDIRD